MEQYEKFLDVDVKLLHDRMQENVIIDNKDNAKKYQDRGIFMGRVGAKKFYILYKPPYMRRFWFMTTLKGDISGTEDGRTRLRYRFGKLKAAIAFASLILVLVTVAAVYAFISNEIELIGNLCILGFWLFGVGFYMVSMVRSREARDRLVRFLEDLSVK